MERSKSSYQFGRFRLVTDERVLLKDGRPVRLAPKAFETLLVLLTKNGHLVSKDELMARVWPATCVEEANLTQNIFMLRKLLGQNSDGRKYIETVARRGYRFIAEVHEAFAEDITAEPERMVFLGDGQRSARIDSLAVLPFINSNDDLKMEYLADGITESTINSLSQLPQLRVMCRSAVFRYKGHEGDPRAIGRDLGVLWVLVGRVRTLENRLMVSTELVDVAHGWQIWGENYSRNADEILDVQEEIAKRITTALRIKLSVNDRQRMTKRYTENSDAYHNYLRGRYYWDKYTRQALEKAIDYFKRAIESDPAYALAYVGVSDAYFRLATSFLPPREALAKAKSAVIKALEIDGDLAEAHASLGMIKMRYDWDWQGAEKEFKKAIELKFGEATFHHWYAVLLDCSARFDEAREQMKVALNFNPISLQMNVSLGSLFWKMRDSDRAVQQLLQTLEMDSNYQPTRLALGLAYEQKGLLQEAAIHLECASRIEKTSIVLACLGRTYALSGRRTEALSLMNRLTEESKVRYVSNYSVATMFLALGDKEKALEKLELAYVDKDEHLAMLRVDPRLDPIRDEKRFKTLSTKIGLPS